MAAAPARSSRVLPRGREAVPAAARALAGRLATLSRLLAKRADWGRAAPRCAPAPVTKALQNGRAVAARVPLRLPSAAACCGAVGSEAALRGCIVASVPVLLSLECSVSRLDLFEPAEAAACWLSCGGDAHALTAVGQHSVAASLAPCVGACGAAPAGAVASTAMPLPAAFACTTASSSSPCQLHASSS